MSEDTKAVVFKSESGEWFFRLVSKGNGEIVSQSEGYERRGDAHATASLLVGPEDVEDELE